MVALPSHAAQSLPTASTSSANSNVSRSSGATSLGAATALPPKRGRLGFTPASVLRRGSSSIIARMEHGAPSSVAVAPRRIGRGVSIAHMFGSRAHPVAITNSSSSPAASMLQARITDTMDFREEGDEDDDHSTERGKKVDEASTAPIVRASRHGRRTHTRSGIEWLLMRQVFGSSAQRMVQASMRCERGVFAMNLCVFGERSVACAVGFGSQIRRCSRVSKRELCAPWCA